MYTTNFYPKLQLETSAPEFSCIKEICTDEKQVYTHAQECSCERTKLVLCLCVCVESAGNLLPPPPPPHEHTHTHTEQIRTDD